MLWWIFWPKVLFFIARARKYSAYLYLFCVEFLGLHWIIEKHKCTYLAIFHSKFQLFFFFKWVKTDEKYFLKHFIGILPLNIHWKYAFFALFSCFRTYCCVKRKHCPKKFTFLVFESYKWCSDKEAGIIRTLFVAVLPTLPFLGKLKSSQI